MKNSEMFWQEIAILIFQLLLFCVCVCVISPTYGKKNMNAFMLDSKTEEKLKFDKKHWEVLS